jgi:hypothetical protein
MHIFDRCNSRTTGFLLLLVLAGCGSTPDKVAEGQAEISENYFVGTGPVYGHLLRGSGGSWLLTTVTRSDAEPGNGYLVRLNDLAPSFDTRTAECEPQVYPANHRCDPGHPFRDKHIGVMNRIISGGIAAGTAGQVTDFSRTYKTIFDDSAFNRAVDEALINTDLGDNRREFINVLERYDELLQDTRATFAARQEKALAQYQDTGNLAVRFRPTITGLTNYYAQDIDFRDIVDIEPRSVTTAESAILNRPGILPCDARQCYFEARSAISKLAEDIENENRNFNYSLAADTSEYALRCEKTSYAGYNFELTCPESLLNTYEDVEVVPLTLNILSRDFDAVYPDIDIGDDSLSVRIDSQKVRFENRTANYLTVTAQTIYYNNQVETQNEQLNIAPGAVVERPVDEMVTPAIRIESSYQRMTPDKADRTSFQFGFAAIYRLAGSSTETTLYDFRNFNLGCTIDNMIRAGSCRYPTTESFSRSARN